MCGVYAMEQGFRCHPLDWQPSICRFPVVIVAVYVPGQTEIGNLQYVLVAHQDIPRC